MDGLAISTTNPCSKVPERRKIHNSTVRKTSITLRVIRNEVKENKVAIRRYGVDKQEATGVS
jgi:hypothetical protein